MVSDGDNKQIQIFDQLGNFIRIFTTGSELSPKGIFVTRQCDIVVCCGNEVRVFTPSKLDNYRYFSDNKTTFRTDYKSKNIMYKIYFKLFLQTES